MNGITSMTDLIYKIAAYKNIDSFHTDDCVDWAIQLLEKNIETPNILILAGLSKPTDQLETVTYLEGALEELEITPLDKGKAIQSYSYFYVLQIINTNQVRSNLNHLYQVFLDEDDDIVKDFALLYWAWDDFDYGASYSDYWDSATIHNVESIVIETAKKWILNHNKIINEIDEALTHNIL